MLSYMSVIDRHCHLFLGGCDVSSVGDGGGGLPICCRLSIGDLIFLEVAHFVQFFLMYIMALR